MTPVEMKTHCENKILAHGDYAHIALHIKGRMGSKRTRSLLGVKGDIVCENLDNTITVMFRAKDVLTALNNILEMNT